MVSSNRPTKEFEPVDLRSGFPQVREFFKAAWQIAFWVFFIRCFVVSLYTIPSGSMIPSLLIGDKVMVSRFAYGYTRYSLPFGYKVPYFSGRVGWVKTPQRGDAVVVALPGNPKILYIKRVVGLPGDRLLIKGGELYVNQKKVPAQPAGWYDDRTDQVFRDSSKKNGLGRLYINQFPNGQTWTSLRHGDGSRAIDNTQEYVVPEGHIFLKGDNTDHSFDSRFSYGIGFVPMDYLIGKALFVFYSLNPHEPWWALHKKIRWDRCFASPNRKIDKGLARDV